MGQLYKRNGTYYADYRYGGQRFRESLKTKDRSVAKERLRLAELGAHRGAEDGPPKALAVAIDDMTALKRDQTASSYQVKALHLCRVLGAERDLHTLTAAEVTDYATTRLGEGAKRHTVHKELVVLRQTLKEAKRRGEYRGPLDVVPAWKAEYEPRTRHLTREQFDKLLASTPPQHRNWIVLQVFTSANKSEVERLTWEHVDMRSGYITVPGRKRTSRFRRVPIGVFLRAWLKTADRAQPLVTPWPAPNHGLKRICERAKIDRVSTNDLRRTFAAWLKQQGVDSLAVAQMMGHSSPTMVNQVYGQLDDATYKRAMARMPRPRGIAAVGTDAGHKSDTRTVKGAR